MVAPLVLRNYSLSGTFTLRVFLSSEWKGNQYQLLALGDSFLLGGFLKGGWQLGWLRDYLFCCILLFFSNTIVVNLFIRNGGRWESIGRGILTEVKIFKSTLSLEA